jgi:hypothetical protein
MFAFILFGLSQNLRECPSQMNTIFIAHFSRQAEVGAKVELLVQKVENARDASLVLDLARPPCGHVRPRHDHNNPAVHRIIWCRWDNNRRGGLRRRARNIHDQPAGSPHHPEERVYLLTTSTWMDDLCWNRDCDHADMDAVRFAGVLACGPTDAASPINQMIKEARLKRLEGGVLGGEELRFRGP